MRRRPSGFWPCASAGRIASATCWPGYSRTALKRPSPSTHRAGSNPPLQFPTPTRYIAGSADRWVVLPILRSISSREKVGVAFSPLGNESRRGRSGTGGLAQLGTSTTADLLMATVAINGYTNNSSDRYRSPTSAEVYWQRSFQRSVPTSRLSRNRLIWTGIAVETA